MSRKLAHILSLALLAAVTWGSGAARAMETLVPRAAPMSEDYVLRTWETDDGLPSNDVTAIDQTPDGFLWLATSRGLARFDGLHFKSFLKSNYPELETDHIFTVFVSRDGALWLGLELGAVARLNGNHFETIVPLPSTRGPTAWIDSFAQDGDGSIWFGHDPNLLVQRWNAGKLSSFEWHEGVTPGFYPEVYADSNGSIWSCTTEACLHFNGTRFDPIDPGAGNVKHMAPSHAGGMWAMRGHQILHYYVDRPPEAIADVGDMDVKKLYEDREGNLWIGTTNQGLFRYREGSMVRVPTSHNLILAIFEDREGNLWVGTNGGGLNCLRPRFFTLRQMKDGLSDNSITSLGADTEGKLWVIGRNNTLVRATDSTNRSFAMPQNWPGYSMGMFDMFPDPSGGMWFGGLATMIHWTNDAFSFRPVPDTVISILLNKKGDMWAASQSELWRKPSGTDNYIPQGPELGQTLALAEDAQGCIWAGTEDGQVFRRAKDHFIKVDLPGAKPREAIRFIMPDGDDTVWIGAYEGGLYRWRAGQVSKLPSNSGLPTDDLRVLAIYPGDDFWFGTGRGLFRVARSQLEAGFAGLPVKYITYGRDDGLPNLEFSYAFRNATTRTPDGNLWFATYKGALEVDVQKAGKMLETASTPTLIEDVELNGTTLPIPEQQILTLPPNPGPLQIHYTQPQMHQAEQIHFRYRLIGLGQEQWFLAGSQRIATFTNLPPGDYRFEVNAARLGGAWLPNLASLAFKVEAAWWQTNLFRIGSVVTGILALVLLARRIVLRRIRARMRLIEQEHALERERTRIARDIHDELGANLTQIHIVSQLAQTASTETVQNRIREVTSIARSTIKLLGEIVWAIDPQCDTLNALIEYISQHAANFLHAAGIASDLDIPDNLPAYPLTAEVRHHLLLVTKESLNNVVKHSEATQAGLKVEMTGNLLRIIITDNGRSFDPNNVHSGSNGLRNMRERMKELGGDYRLETQPGIGTCATFELLLKPVRK